MSSFDRLRDEVEIDNEIGTMDFTAAQIAQWQVNMAAPLDPSTSVALDAVYRLRDEMADELSEEFEKAKAAAATKKEQESKIVETEVPDDVLAAIDAWIDATLLTATIKKTQEDLWEATVEFKRGSVTDSESGVGKTEQDARDQLEELLATEICGWYGVNAYEFIYQLPEKKETIHVLQ